MHSWDRVSVFVKDAKLKSPPLPPPPPPPPPVTPPSANNCNKISPKYAPRQTNASSLESSESEELQRLVHAPPFWKSSKKKLSKQMSMNETHRDVAWEKKRQRQVIRERKRKSMNFDADDLTDEDLNELRGFIELGFGFSEETCQKLCNTLPALDLYFAVHRQLSISPVSTPHSNNSTNSLGVRSASFESPRSENSWKILGPGDDPQQVKTKLRHWAQVVACSVMQSI